MTGIAVTGGKAPDFEKIKNIFHLSDFLIAADSGLDYCFENSLVPHYIIGDMDSLRQKSRLDTMDPEIIERHSEEKDYTDTELALQHLIKTGCRKKILVGGGGGRADHFLAIYSMFYREDKPDLWITHNSYIQLIQGSSEIDVLPETTVSLFPLKHECRMHSAGLYWPLDKLIWSPGDHGVSNRTTESKIRIEMEEGELLMVRSLDSVLIPSRRS